MSRGARPGVLLALLLLAPLAQAGDPEALSWSPYTARSTPQAVALAAEGPAIAVGLAMGGAQSGGVGSTPRVVREDFVVLDLGAGYAKHTDRNRPMGSPVVAASRDGSTVASLGNESVPETNAPPLPDPGDPNSAGTVLQLSYMRAAPGGNFTSPGTRWHNATLEGAPVALLLSADGRSVAVALNSGTQFVLRGFVLDERGLDSRFTYRGEGAVHGLAGPADLSRFYAVATVPQGESRRGVVLSVPFDTGIPTGTYTDLSEGNTTMRAIATDRSGGLLAAGTGAGRLLVFRVAGPLLPEPAVVDLGRPPQALAVSDDATRIAAAAETNLTHFDATGSTPQVLWTAATAKPANSIAYNRTGAILVAGLAADGLYAYGDDGPQPLWRNPGDARSASIQASGEVVAFARNNAVVALRLPRLVSLDHVTGGNEATPRLVKPPGVATWDLTLGNPGAAPEQIVLSAPAAEDVQVSIEPAFVSLRPGETRRVSVSAEVGRDFVGARLVPVTARSLSSGARDDAMLSLALQTSANVTLLVDDTDVTVRPGEPAVLLVGVQNRGTKDAAVGIRAIQQPSMGGPWNVEVDPASLTLAPSSLTTVRVSVTAPMDTPNGTSLALTLALEGQDGSDAATIHLRINPSLGMEIGATPRIKFVQPGTAAHYNVTVKNTGSVPRTFEAWYDIVPIEGAAPRAWAVDVPASEFRLNAGDTRTIPVRILAPADVTPADRVSVRITARMIPLNDTEERILGNVTLFANGEAPPPTTPDDADNAIPGPGPAAALVLVAALALLRRRLR